MDIFTGIIFLQSWLPDYGHRGLRLWERFRVMLSWLPDYGHRGLRWVDLIICSCRCCERKNAQASFEA